MTQQHYVIHADNGAHGIICIDRDAGTATILRTTPTLLSRLAAIAEAQKTPPVRIIVDPTNEDLLKELEDEGWQCTEFRVYVKG